MSNIVKVNGIYAQLPAELSATNANDYNNLAYKTFVINDPTMILSLSRYIKENPPKEMLKTIQTMQKDSIKSVVTIIKTLCQRISHELSIDNRVSDYSHDEIIHHTSNWNMIDFFTFAKKAGSGQYKQQYDTTKNGLTIDLLMNWIKVYDELKLDDIRTRAKDEQVTTDFNINNLNLKAFVNNRIAIVRSKRMAFLGSIKRIEVDEQLELKITECVKKIQVLNDLILALKLGGDTAEVKDNMGLLKEYKSELDGYHSKSRLSEEGAIAWQAWITSWYGEFVPFCDFENLIDGQYIVGRIRKGIAYLYDKFGWVDACICLKFPYNDTNGYEPSKEEFIEKIYKAFVEREFHAYREIDLDAEEIPLFRYEWDWYRFRLLFGNFVNKK